MTNNAGLQSVTTEYRWGVADVTEPPDIRLVVGYVTVLAHRSPADSAFVNYKLLFSDADGRPLTTFSPQDLALLAKAAALAMAELEEEAADVLKNGPLPLAVLVPLASSE